MTFSKPFSSIKSFATHAISLLAPSIRSYWHEKKVPQRYRSSTDAAHPHDVLPLAHLKCHTIKKPEAHHYFRKKADVYQGSHRFCGKHKKPISNLCHFFKHKRACFFNPRNKGFLLILDLQH